MQERDDLTPAEAELAKALAGLHPARPTLNRDRLLFLAGCAAGRRAGRFWQGASAVLAACLAAALGVWGPAGSGPPPERAARPAEPVDARDEPPLGEPPAAAVPPAPEGTYLRLRDEVLARGPAALPPMRTSGAPAEALTLAELHLRSRRRESQGVSPQTLWTLPGWSGNP